MYWNETCTLINQVKGDSGPLYIRNCWHEGNENADKGKVCAYAAYKSREDHALGCILHSISRSNLEWARDLEGKSWRRISNSPWSDSLHDICSNLRYARTYCTKDSYVKKLHHLLSLASSPDPMSRQTGSINQSNYLGTLWLYENRMLYKCALRRIAYFIKISV